MGRGGGGKGRKGKSSIGDQGHSSRCRGGPRHDDGHWWPSADGQWQDHNGWGTSSQDWASQGAQAAAALPQRPLAAQWRFYCRVLRRHAPEEAVRDARQEVNVGDHLIVHYDWDCGQQHGIVASAPGEDGGRRSDRQALSVIHWDGSSELQRTPLSQFAKGGKLCRVGYPHWVCQCVIPAASTMKVHVATEQQLQARPSESVAKEAMGAHRNGWRPRWSQAVDLEFCLQMKTGAGPPFEVHAQKTVNSSLLAPIGCSVGGEAAPSQLFGTKSDAVVSLSSHAGQGGHATQAIQMTGALQGAAQPCAAAVADWVGAQMLQHAVLPGGYDASYMQDHNWVAQSFYSPHQWGGDFAHGHAAYHQDPACWRTMPAESMEAVHGHNQGWPLSASASLFVPSGAGEAYALQGGAEQQQDETAYQ